MEVTTKMSYYNAKIDNTDVSTIGWRLASIPVITHSTKNRDRFSIPARDGEILGSSIWRSNAYVNCVFHSRISTAFGGTLTDTLDDRINALYSLLINCKKLYIESSKIGASGNDSCGYYEIEGYNIVNEVRKYNDYIRIEVQFEVYPYKFKLETYPTTQALTIVNSYDDCMPLYELNRGSTGSTATFTLTVNGNTMSLAIPANCSNAYIDTRLQIAYYEGAGNTKYELKATGDYRGLMLPAKSTSVLSTTGYTGSLITTPRWGYKI